MIRIRLSPEELAQLQREGEARQKSAMANGESHKAPGCPGAGARNNVVGIIGEYMVSKMLGVSWVPGLKLGSRDIDAMPGVEVRSTASVGGNLFIRQEDQDESVFYLCYVDITRKFFAIAGWITGKEGKQVGQWKKLQYGPPLYCVPSFKLYNGRHDSDV